MRTTAQTVMKMSEYNFAFLVSGVKAHDDDFADRFFEAGCDDATLMLVRGVVAVCFAREADNYAHAVVSAYANILATGAEIERFEPDFLVSQSEIASRANLTRSAVNHYVSGERGDGNFPVPTARITSSSPLWDWVDVSGWLHKHKLLEADEVINARISRTMNYTVQYPGKTLRGSEKNLMKVMEGVAKEPLTA